MIGVKNKKIYVKVNFLSPLINV